MGTFFKKIFPYAGMLVVVAVVGYFARQNHNYFEKIIVEQARRQLLDTVRFEASSLNQHVLNLTQELEILSGQEVIQEAFAYGPGKIRNVGFSLLDDSFKDVKTLADSLSMVDARGVVIYGAPSRDNIGKDLSSESDVRRALADRHVQASGIVYPAARVPVLTFVQPVLSQGRFVGLLRAVISLETLQAIVNRNVGGGAYAFLFDQDGRFLSYPDKHYLGQSVATLFADGHLSLDKSGFQTLMDQGLRGEEGSGICQLFPVDSPHEAEAVIVAFSPVYFGSHVWSLVSGIDYDAVSGPVNRNARDNIVFAGLVVLILLLSVAFFYRDQKRKNSELQRLYQEQKKNLQDLSSAQSMLIQSAKMESVGRLAAGVAHEVKNPLAIILMGVKYFRNNIKSKDEHVPVFLDDIEGAVNRADAIVNDLLDFSSITGLEIKSQDIHAIIDKSLLLVKHALKKANVRVIKELGEGLPAVNVDKNKVEQVFVNFFMNAVEAMPDGGELRVRTFREGAGGRVDWVVVRIEDTGMGIPESVLKDLFVPFVTTKRSVGGTGLGLSIVKNIMELHGGKVILENKAEGPGARATLWFKIQQEAGYG